MNLLVDRAGVTWIQHSPMGHDFQNQNREVENHLPTYLTHYAYSSSGWTQPSLQYIWNLIFLKSIFLKELYLILLISFSSNPFKQVQIGLLFSTNRYDHSKSKEIVLKDSPLRHFL